MLFDDNQLTVYVARAKYTTIYFEIYPPPSLGKFPTLDNSYLLAVDVWEDAATEKASKTGRKYVEVRSHSSAKKGSQLSTL